MTDPSPAEEFADLTHFELDAEMIRTLPEDLCREHRVVLLGRVPESRRDTAALGMMDVCDDRAARAAETRASWPLRRVQLNAYEFDRALKAGFGEGEGETAVPASRHQRLVLSHEGQIRFDRDQPAVRMVVDMLSRAVAMRASDVHIEVYPTDVDVRFRVDGVLQQIPTPLSVANVRSVVSCLKVMADLDIAEKRRSQDGRIGNVYTDADGSTRQIDMRLAVLPGPNGEDAVLRVLDERRISLKLADLGMAQALEESFRRMVHTPGGIVLVTGPTASGKTTTLYAALKDMNTDGNKILTVEDPVEYVIPRVNQKQVTPAMSFADYSRAFIRQNPDVLMIGEIKDEETADMVLRAAQIGHLVLTTVHARNAFSAVSRLAALGGDRSLTASALLGVLSQRLVRRVCRDCAEPCAPDPDLLRRLPGIPESGDFKRGKGCDACRGTGYRGQVGVFELLDFDDAMRSRLFRAEELSSSTVPGFSHMFADAAAKAAAGVTTPEEVLRAVPLPNA